MVGALVWLAVVFWLGVFKKTEPFYSYFYIFAWSAYLWMVSCLLHRRTERWPVKKGRDLLGWGLFSAALWCLFELFNLRLQNWSYIGVPPQLYLRWPGYALSFATVAPGILWTARLLEGEVPSRIEGQGGQPAAPTVPLGLFMLLLPLLWPRWFFPLIWGAVFFLAEPFVGRLGGHSLWRDWRGGRWETTRSLLLSGFICGIFWELCNYGAGGKWIYHLPYWNFLKIFEMPLLGFLGFPAFALEVHALYELAKTLWHRSGPAQRYLLILGAVLFCVVAFYEIDRRTVQRSLMSGR